MRGRRSPSTSTVQPDIILLDLMMPEMDGFAVMEHLRPLIPAESYLPILVLTADTSMQTKRRALAAGAKDFLTKPFDAVELALRVRTLLQTRSLHRQLAEQNTLLETRVQERTQDLASGLRYDHRGLVARAGPAGQGDRRA